jgi:hypothetical protein
MATLWQCSIIEPERDLCFNTHYSNPPAPETPDR